MNPPRPGRLYWICQAAGWGSFTAYVLVGYLIAVPHPRLVDVVSIVFFDAVVCPAATHVLRRYMYVHGWMQMPLRRLVPRMSVVLPAIGLGITVTVAAGIALTSPVQLDRTGFASIFIGITWGLVGWFIIYYAVHARRRRDALQLQLQVVTRDAQLRALRAQLNPHFLFNSLNSLRHLIGANPDRAVEMVTGLADLLRYSLASDRVDLVSLGEELQVVDEYLALEHVRFEERLRIERAIEPAALSARVPPMLIQGLVDNALKHGIADLPKGGVVQIGARVVDSRVEIRVANTGGLKPAPPASVHDGHGLTNATERLRLLYDGAASLTLREVDGMTVAELIVPVTVGARGLQTPGDP